MHLSSYVQVVVSLLTVLGLLWGVSWAMRRYMVPHALRTPSPNLLITGHLALDVKHRLVELCLNGKRYYIILGGTQPVVILGEEGEEIEILRAKS
jgi:hypothetical protein